VRLAAQVDSAERASGQLRVVALDAALVELVVAPGA
jgi:hypothetical protein